MPLADHVLEHIVVLSLFSTMDTVAIILTTIFGFLVFLCVFWRKKRNLPPGPTPVPLLGNLILFRKDPRAYKLYTKLAEEYGNIYSLHCGSTLIVILNGYDAINEAFVKQADVFTDRPQLFVPLIGVSKGTGSTIVPLSL